MARYNLDEDKRRSYMIISNKDFDGRPTRTGTDYDVKAMSDTLDKLKFTNVDGGGKRTNLSKQAMVEAMNEVANKDYSDCSCFVGVILTYGESGYVLGVDGQSLTIPSLLAPFKGKLPGKPKVFFIQSCSETRVVKTDGVVATTDSDVKLPLEADFFIAQCSLPGQLTWKAPTKTNCSPFIHTTCEAFKNLSTKKDVYSIMTTVKANVYKTYQGHPGNSVTIEARLLKDLYF